MDVKFWGKYDEERTKYLLTEYKNVLEYFSARIDFNVIINHLKNFVRLKWNDPVERILANEYYLPIVEYVAELFHGPRYSSLKHRLSSVLPLELIGHAYSMVDYKEKNRVYIPRRPSHELGMRKTKRSNSRQMARQTSRKRSKSPRRSRLT